MSKQPDPVAMKPLHKLGGTLFAPLPVCARRPILQGCRCKWCEGHPGATPQWDTLAIDAANPSQTWTVHYPELANSYSGNVPDLICCAFHRSGGDRALSCGGDTV